MTRAIIEEEIKRVLATVNGVGTIGYTNPQFIGALTDTEIIGMLGITDADAAWNFWTLERTSTTSQDEGVAFGQVAIGAQLMRTHTFSLIGYSPIMIAEDLTTNGPDFQALIDRMLIAFDDEASLGGFDSRPIQLESVGTLTVLGRVSFRAVMRLSVLELVNVRRGNW